MRPKARSSGYQSDDELSSGICASNYDSARDAKNARRDAARKLDGQPNSKGIHPRHRHSGVFTYPLAGAQCLPMMRGAIST